MLPGTTAIWGAAPGAATVMTLMCESYGADMRLVAFMQYLRVAVCLVVATLMAHMLGIALPAHSLHWLAAQPPWPAELVPLAVALAGAAAGAALGLPGGGLLVPLAVGLAVKFAFGVTLALPPAALVAGYALIGWGIGMRFEPAVLAHAARVLPRVLAAILGLVAVCGGLAALLVVFAGVDPLTAYLATSPGGADSMALIAVATRVDVPFVMAMQVARFILVLVAGPVLARRLSKVRGAA